MNRRPRELVFQRCRVVLFILEKRTLGQHFIFFLTRSRHSK